MKCSYWITLLIVSIISISPAHAGKNDEAEKLQRKIAQLVSDALSPEKQDGTELQEVVAENPNKTEAAKTTSDAEKLGIKRDAAKSQETVIEVITVNPGKEEVAEEMTEELAAEENAANPLGEPQDGINSFEPEEVMGVIPKLQNPEEPETAEGVISVISNKENASSIDSLIVEEENSEKFDVEKQLIKDSKKKKREKYCSPTRMAKIFGLTWLFAGTSVIIPLNVIALNESEAMIETSSPRIAFVGNGTLPYQAGCLYSTYNGTTAPACTRGECPRIKGYYTCMLKECGEHFTIEKYLKECEGTHFALKAAIAVSSMVSAGVAMMTMGTVLAYR